MSTTDERSMELEGQIRALTERRNELQTQLQTFDDDLQRKITQLGGAMLDGQVKEIANLKREIAAGETDQKALEIAISEASIRIAGFAAQLAQHQRQLAEDEYKELAKVIAEGVKDVMRHMYAIDQVYPGLVTAHGRLNELGSVHRIVPGMFLDPLAADAVEATKKIKAWDLKLKLSVFEKHLPALDADIKASMKE